MDTAQIKDIPRGEYFRRTSTSAKVYIRGEYIRGTTRRYSCMDTEDANREIFLKGTTVVVVGFTY